MILQSLHIPQPQLQTILHLCVSFQHTQSRFTPIPLLPFNPIVVCLHHRHIHTTIQILRHGSPSKQYPQDHVFIYLQYYQPPPYTLSSLVLLWICSIYPSPYSSLLVCPGTPILLLVLLYLPTQSTTYQPTSLLIIPTKSHILN